LAVALIVMVTGAGPQSNVMIPPAATALTTADDVQLEGVPLPTVRVGWLVSTARPAAGTVACPPALPGFGSSFGFGVAEVFEGVGEGGFEADVVGAGAAEDDGAGTKRSENVEEGDEQALSSPKTATRGISRDRTGG
jgi:hypothetical protein